MSSSSIVNSNPPTTLTYVQHASRLVSNATDISIKSYSLVQHLDEAIQRISNIIDANRIKSSRQISSSSNSSSNNTNSLAIDDLQKLFKIAEDLSERKAQIVLKNYDLIDHNMKIIDNELTKVRKIIDKNPINKKLNLLEEIYEKDTKKRKNHHHNIHEDRTAISAALDGVLIDPNEPLYCFCRQVAYGEMIACDNEECEVEWFHYPCVNLTKKPRSTWVCSVCKAK